jgi:glycosyltransferase involved in cell wall biosynthesis
MEQVGDEGKRLSTLNVSAPRRKSPSNGRAYKVALVTPSFPESRGTASVTRFLYDCLSASSDFDPFIISLATSATDHASVRLLNPSTWAKGPVAMDDQHNGVAFTHVGTWATEIELQRYRPRRVLRDLLSTSDLIQVVAGSPAWGMAVAGTAAPKALQIATLLKSERRSRFDFEPWGLRKWWFRLMTAVGSVIEKRSLLSADLVLVENPIMHKSVTALRGTDDVVLAPPGVDTDVFRPAGKLRDDGPILTVGRLRDPRKNLRMLFRAYAEVRSLRPHVPPLMLVGHEPSESDIQYANSLNLRGSYEIRTNLEQHELAEEYRSASIFVLASDEEGFGLVVLEAMASGLPIISTRCGGPETLVRPNVTGLLTAVGDSHDLARAIIRLVDDKQLRTTFGAKGRALAVSEFSKEKCAHTFMVAYRDLLKRRSDTRTQTTSQEP